MQLLFFIISQGHLKVFGTGGAEGVLHGVMKLKNPIFAKGREYKNMLSKEKFEFHPIYSYFLGHFAPVCYSISKSLLSTMQL